ncbi:hypothetical protein NKR23_g9597 [Pleurostoma richardsiae]|uniref:Uncharacterized protein n=1 Tax=Pleurostoma richardsiae TaxID=41990 RepID=A0AA38VMS2_9PEZI|nr:hypothetical protein NKR23_g9597 [Pleurostoma richardsiae]
MGRSRRTSRRPLAPRLQLCLSMASTASAISLADFQLISSSSVPLGCILAYNTPIVGCSSSDFTQGNTCSSSCERGLQLIEATISSVCDNVDVSSNSVLGQALSGDLVDLLCPTGKTTTAATTSLSSKSTTAAVVLTSKSETTTVTLGSFTVIPTPSTTSAVTETTKTETSTVTTEASTSSSTTSVDASPAAQTTSAAQTPAAETTSSSTKTTSSTHKAEATRGGGSPFDATVANSSPALSVRWTKQLLLAALCGLLLLR